MNVAEYIALYGLAQNIALGNVCGGTMGKIRGRALTTKFGGLVVRAICWVGFGEMVNALGLRGQDGLWSNISADPY